MDLTTLLSLPVLVSVLTSMFRLSTPLIYGALGGLVSERSGVLNIALEGLILVGAFSYMAGGTASGSVAVAMLCAVTAPTLLALLLAYMCINLHMDQVIAGMAVNLMAAGGTAFLSRSWTDLQVGTAPGMGALQIPGLSDLPLVGPVLFSMPPLTYGAFVLVLAVWLFLNKVRYGLWLRATGEDPLAAEAAGINVIWMRYLAVATSGFLCGLGGAFLLSQVHSFSEGMTAGVGFIALAAVIFGKWEPGGMLIASLLFAFFQSLQTALQVAGLKVAYQFLLMVPYIMTILVLAGFVGRARPPASEGKPYYRS